MFGNLHVACHWITKQVSDLPCNYFENVSNYIRFHADILLCKYFFRNFISVTSFHIVIITISYYGYIISILLISWNFRPIVYILLTFCKYPRKYMYLQYVYFTCNSEFTTLNATSKTDIQVVTIGSRHSILVVVD